MKEIIFTYRMNKSIMTYFMTILEQRMLICILLKILNPNGSIFIPKKLSNHLCTQLKVYKRNEDRMLTFGESIRL